MKVGRIANAHDKMNWPYDHYFQKFSASPLS